MNRLPEDRQRLAILGATGSIGRSTLDLVRQHPDRFEIVAISAHQDDQGLLRLVQEFHPRMVCLSDKSAAARLREALALTPHR